MTPAEMAIENVESVLRGEITEPSVGTLAHRVLEFARGYGQPIVTVTCVSAPDWLSRAVAGGADMGSIGILEVPE